MKHQPKNSNNHWRPCKPGTIGQVSGHVDPQLQRRQFVKSMLSWGVAASGVVGVSIFAASRPAKSKLPGGLACAQVHEYLIELVADRIEDKELRKNLATHLAACQHCNNAYLKLQGPQQTSPPSINCQSGPAKLG